MPTYKSYCWALGTTSFRMVEFNRKIEIQLQLLNQFWNNPKYVNKKWSANKNLQQEYYQYIKAQGFIEDRDAPRKDKDAREKTSGLVDLGLIDKERRLTLVGQELLKILEKNNFKGNNILQIPSDSFIYFNQLLKLSCEFDNGFVRPFVVFAYMLSKLGYLSKKEFTYLLPLAIDNNKTNYIIQEILKIRVGNGNIDNCIIAILSEMDNYIDAKKLFLSNPISEKLIMDIGMNRKSHKYDKAYFEFYNALWIYKNNKSKENVLNLFSKLQKISGKAKVYWKQYVFNAKNYSSIEKDYLNSINNIALFNADSEHEFKSIFFDKLHLFKSKSLLDDYYDLNKRYFKISDTILFKDDQVKFDIIPHCYFDIIQNELINIAFTQDNNLQNYTNLSDLGKNFNVDQKQIFERVEKLYGVQVRNLYDIQNFVELERYNRFNKMIDTKFTDNIIIDLLTKFEKRQDNEIREIVTKDADIPTIFEYIIAVAWYKVSGKTGKVLDYMNLSLDADLLPITHASGGHEDITYHYDSTQFYPEHTLLLEATLSSSTNQRRMEMEPVSRHLGDYLLNNPNKMAYCLFATTFLHINVVSDFRNRKNMQYYSLDGTKCVNGMKIIPCQTSEIKKIIKNGIKYSQLYSIFDSAYDSDIEPNKWYEEGISKNLN